MSVRHAVCTVFLVAIGVSPCPAADLTKIPRTILKEPAYKTKPKYCLLVFGPEAKTRVWLVLDGNVLYVDRNGNGDLTEKDERVEPYPVRLTGLLGPGEKEPDAKRFSCEIAKNQTVEVLKIGDHYLQVDFKNSQQKLSFAASRDGQGSLRFADKPSEAPVIHFNGPLTFCLSTGQVLERGPKPRHLFANIGTPGLGAGTFAAITCESVPAGLHPVVVVEFPTKKRDGKPIRIRVHLNQRC